MAAKKLPTRKTLLRTKAFVCNGSATASNTATNSSVAITLTPATPDCCGSAWWLGEDDQDDNDQDQSQDQDHVDHGDNWMVEFAFRVGSQGGGGGADGFAFVAHNDPDGYATIGQGGAQLGYGGIRRRYDV